MSTHPKALKNVIYGRKWAIDVVQRFVERYSRGCHRLAIAYEMSHSNLYARLVRLCRLEQQCHWERAKWLIKNVDRDNLPADCLHQYESLLAYTHFWDDIYMDSNCDFKKTEKSLDNYL